MSPLNPELRRQVIVIYKELLNLGKDYPQGFNYFRPRLHKAFMANAHLRDDEAIRNAISKADYVRKGRLPPFYTLYQLNTSLHDWEALTNLLSRNRGAVSQSYFFKFTITQTIFMGTATFQANLTFIHTVYEQRALQAK
ncbi:hypothetical protein F4804DRAFT_17281 [Jackrogersella minutella]|nr:hypothetical protein F4804DRAFT_17281 [Jackrogersella minutella]